jgi:hypothetical protein
MKHTISFPPPSGPAGGLQSSAGGSRRYYIYTSHAAFPLRNNKDRLRVFKKCLFHSGDTLLSCSTCDELHAYKVIRNPESNPVVCVESVHKFSLLGSVRGEPHEQSLQRCTPRRRNVACPAQTSARELYVVSTGTRACRRSSETSGALNFEFGARWSQMTRSRASQSVRCFLRLLGSLGALAGSTNPGP